MSENKRCASCGQLNESDKDGIYRNKCWYCKNDLPDANMEEKEPSTPSKDLLKDGDKLCRWVKCADRMPPNGQKLYYTKYGLHYEEANPPYRGTIFFDHGFHPSNSSYYVFEWLEEIEIPIPSNGEKVYRWVKVSDVLPIHKAHWNTNKMGEHDNDFPVRMNGRYAMANIYDQRKTNAPNHKYMLSFEGKEHYENEFTEIEWLDDRESPLNQPGIDREEKQDPELPIIDFEGGMLTENGPVSAVNAPSELPEETKQWIEEKATERYEQFKTRIGATEESSYAYLYGCRDLATDLYHKLQEDPNGQFCKGFEKATLKMKKAYENMRTDRDLYRKESDDLRKAWEEATSILSERNVKEAEREQEIEDYRKLLIELREDPSGYSWTLREVKKLLKKYPKTEEQTMTHSEASKAFWPDIMQLAEAMTGDPEIAKEITGQTFSCLANKFGIDDLPSREMQAYLYMTAKRLSIDWFKKVDNQVNLNCVVVYLGKVIQRQSDEIARLKASLQTSHDQIVHLLKEKYNAGESAHEGKRDE